jgi:hypothetical protein
MTKENDHSSNFRRLAHWQSLQGRNVRVLLGVWKQSDDDGKIFRPCKLRLAMDFGVGPSFLPQ